VVYLTPVYSSAAQNPLVHLALHAHLLAVGYLATAAFIGVDPAPHRPSRASLAVLLQVATASHAVLAMYLYVNLAGIRHDDGRARGRRAHVLRGRVDRSGRRPAVLGRLVPGCRAARRCGGPPGISARARWLTPT